MIDAARIVAELRAQELVAALQAAISGAPHWRSQALRLLQSISDLELPEPVNDALRAIDARKRAAEVMEDLVSYQEHADG